MKKSQLREGITLLTRDSQRVSNAVYVKELANGRHLALSDFGNQMEFTLDELANLYKFSEDYALSLQYGIHYQPTSIRERFEDQLRLLMDAKSALDITTSSLPVTYIRLCVMDGNHYARNLPIPESKFLEFLNTPKHCRKKIQDAFPELDVNDREFILTGITPELWDEIIGDENE